jgi:hypothetical protein
MVNDGLKKAGRFGQKTRFPAPGTLKRNLATNAALTTQTIDAGHPQKLFWPSRFMVY